MPRTAEPEARPPSLAEAARTWARIGWLGFGGPAGQIALMHRVLVEEKRWIEEERFLHALNYCMLLPGPEAQQLATYVGWLLHRTWGGLVAGVLFVVPGFLAILLLSWLYAAHGDVAVVGSIFFGVKAAVLAIVVEALLRIGRRALRGRACAWIATLAFLSIFLLAVPFPWIVLGAGVAGVVLGLGGRAPVVSHARTRGHLARSLRVVLVCLALWAAPLVAALGLLGGTHVFVVEGLFFSKAAVVTFGGAYAVLAYIAQQAVETYGWLLPGEMLDGLGLAETTPGPLIMVVQFVGFLGAWRNPGPFDPAVAGVLGAMLTTWVTFVPCFLWIFLGAPYVEALRGNAKVAGALRGITAAVVGVILNLAVWFALHVLFGQVAVRHVGPLRLHVPNLQSLDPAAALLAAASAVALLVLRVGLGWTLAGAALAGLLLGRTGS